VAQLEQVDGVFVFARAPRHPFVPTFCP